jgi:alginate biosynthesis protein AlgK
MDNAVARGYLPALISKANFMISNPTEHNAEEVQALIGQVRARQDPTGPRRWMPRCTWSTTG